MASEKERLPGIKESEFFLNFECAARKYGLGILLGIILAALLGIFSGGYFSTAEKTNAPGNLTVTYERFGRLQTEFRLKITSPINIFLASAVILPLPLNQAASGPGRIGCTARTIGCFWCIMI